MTLKAADLEFQKETPTQVFSFEFCEIFQNSCAEEQYHAGYLHGID